MEKCSINQFLPEKNNKSTGKARGQKQGPKNPGEGRIIARKKKKNVGESVAQ